MRSRLVVLGALLFCSGAGAGSFPGGNGLIAYEHTVAGSTVIEAYDPATGASNDLVTGGQPAWSPGGAKLAFVLGDTVYVANADGTGTRAVGAGSWPSWSPDSARLAVARYDGVAAPQRPQGTRQLDVIDLGTLAETQLTSGSEDVVLPAWSPGGAAIAYATATGLEVFDLPSSTTRQLSLPGPPNGGPSWSPDGTKLAFIGSNGQVWITNADGSGPMQVTHTVLGTNGPARPAWSPDGTHIAWAQNADLCITDLAGAVRRLTYTQQSSATVVASLPDWQPASPGTAQPVAAHPVPNARQSCDWNPAVTVTIAQHASIRYGAATILAGTAHGPAGAQVGVWARPLGASQLRQIASVTPVNGSWRLSVAPRVGTEYIVVFASAQDQRVLNVRLALRVHRTGHTITASVVPRLGHSTALLFRFTPSRLLLWTSYRSARLDPTGKAIFKSVPTGRYYVAVLGGNLYLDTASEPFSVGR